MDQVQTKVTWRKDADESATLGELAADVEADAERIWNPAERREAYRASISRARRLKSRLVRAVGWNG